MQKRSVALPWRLTGIVLLSLAAGGALAQPGAPLATRLVFGLLTGPGEPVTTEWQLPDAEPRAWVLLQHGFGRQCANLRGTARRLAEQGLATLCLQADMAHGAPDLARRVARAIAAESADASWRPLHSGIGPVRWLLAGHSAGAWFAARIGGDLVRLAPDRLAGLMLVDPVGSGGLGERLAGVAVQGHRPVWAFLAPPSRCNAQQQALAALQAVQASVRVDGRPGAVRLVLQDPATHLDIEGEDTEGLAVWLCGGGWPDAARTEALRGLMVSWADELLRLPQGPGAAAPPVVGSPAGSPQAAGRP